MSLPTKTENPMLISIVPSVEPPLSVYDWSPLVFWERAGEWLWPSLEPDFVPLCFLSRDF